MPSSLKACKPWVDPAFVTIRLSSIRTAKIDLCIEGTTRHPARDFFRKSFRDKAWRWRTCQPDSGVRRQRCGNGRLKTNARCYARRSRCGGRHRDRHSDGRAAVTSPASALLGGIFDERR